MKTNERQNEFLNTHRLERVDLEPGTVRVESAKPLAREELQLVVLVLVLHLPPQVLPLPPLLLFHLHLILL